MKFDHSWSAALILSFDDISDPPHEASSIKGTFTVNDETISIIEEKGLLIIVFRIIWIVFIMFRNKKSSIDCESDIFHIVHLDWHNGKLYTLWNDNLSVS
jgi:hypothetical protein